MTLSGLQTDLENAARSVLSLHAPKDGTVIQGTVSEVHTTGQVQDAVTVCVSIDGGEFDIQGDGWDMTLNAFNATVALRLEKPESRSRAMVITDALIAAYHGRDYEEAQMFVSSFERQPTESLSETIYTLSLDIIFLAR